MDKFGWTRLGRDGQFANFLSAGWQDNQLIWQGSSLDMPNQAKSTQRIVITQHDPSAFEMVTASQDPETQAWQTLAQHTCTRQTQN